MMKLVFAFCTYNRTDQLVKLVTTMRAQDCPVSFVILAGYNNQGNTLAVLEQLAREPGANLRYVTEISKTSYPSAIGALKCWIMTFWFFMDDHELHQKGLLNAAYDAIFNRGTVCR